MDRVPVSGDLAKILAEAYGPSRRDPARPDVTAVVDALEEQGIQVTQGKKISASTVRRWIAASDRGELRLPDAVAREFTSAAAAGTRSTTAFFRAISGREQADASGDTSGDLAGALLAAYGPSKRDRSKPDTAAAARDLGVTQRTVQRWLASSDRQHQRPRSATAQKISEAAQQAARGRQGRQAAVDQLPSRYGREGIRVTIQGSQGPEPAYARMRTVGFDLARPELAQGFFDAYIAGGDKAARKFITDNIEEAYNLDRWHFEDVQEVDISGPYGIG